MEREFIQELMLNLARTLDFCGEGPRQELWLSEKSASDFMREIVGLPKFSDIKDDENGKSFTFDHYNFTIKIQELKGWD